MSPNVIDATSFYRAGGILPQLERQFQEELEATTWYDSWNWANFEMADAFFFQRPFRDTDLRPIEYAKKAFGSRPIWLDYDDDLFTVNIDNPAHVTYGNKDVQDRVARICSMATYITVSSEHLVKVYGQFCPNVFYVPNAMSQTMLDLKPPIRHPREKKILWRGGGSHVRDLMPVNEAIVKLSYEFPEWKFEFVGYKHDTYWWLFETLKDGGIYVSQMDIYDFLPHLWESKAAISIVPLRDTVFNRGKSNIAWLETAWAGCAPVIPNNIPDFDRCPGFKYDPPSEENNWDATDFEKVLREAITNEEKREQIALRAHGQAVNKHTLTAANKIRFDLLRRYIKR